MSAVFNGSNAYLEVSSGLGQAANGTLWISLWCKTTTAIAGLVWLGVTDVAGASGNYRGIQIVTTRLPRARTQASNSNATGTAGSGGASNTWFHILVGFTSTNSRVCYINGIAGTTNTTTLSSSTPTTLRFAREDDLGSPYFTGELAQCIIFNSAPSGGDITKLSSGSDDPLTINTSGRVAYYPLDDDVQDYGGSGYHLTNNNATFSYSPYSWPKRTGIATDSESASAVRSVAVSLASVASDYEAAIASYSSTLTAAMTATDSESAVSSPSTTLTVAGTLAASDSESAVASPIIALAPVASASDSESASGSPSSTLDASASASDSETAVASPQVNVETSATGQDSETAAASVSLALETTASASDQEDAAGSPVLDLEPMAEAADYERASASPDLETIAEMVAGDAEAGSMSPSLDLELGATAVDEDAAHAEAETAVEGQEERVAHAEDTETASASVVLLTNMDAVAGDSESPSNSPSLTIDLIAQAMDYETAVALAVIYPSLTAAASDSESVSASVTSATNVSASAVDTESASAVLADGVSQADASDSEEASAFPSTTVLLQALAIDRENARATVVNPGEDRLAKVILRGIVAAYLTAKRDDNFFILNDFEVKETYNPKIARKNMPPGGVISVVCMAADDTIASRDQSHTSEIPLQIAYQRPLDNVDDVEYIDQLITLEEQLRDVVRAAIKTDKRFVWNRTVALKDENQTPYDFVSLTEYAVFQTYFMPYFSLVKTGGVPST